MRKFTSFLAVILIVTASHAVMAQRGGGGHGRGGGGRGGGPGGSDPDMPNIQKMIAVEASKNQKEQFATWMHSTETLKQQLHDLQAVVGTNEFSSKADALKTTVAQTKDEQEKFENGLTKAQTAGLKKPVQSVKKANDALARDIEKSTRELGHAKTGAGTSKIENLEKLATKLSVEQKKLGDEMGI